MSPVSVTLACQQPAWIDPCHFNESEDYRSRHPYPCLKVHPGLHGEPQQPGKVRYPAIAVTLSADLTDPDREEVVEPWHVEKPRREGSPTAYSPLISH
jgi:hypothetical protein